MKKRLKPLLPSLKERKRYLAFEVVSEDRFDFNQIYQSIKYSSEKIMGTLNSSKAGIQILKEAWNKEKQRGIIRVNHKFVHDLKSSFLFIKNIDGKQALIKSIGLSGVINKARQMVSA